MKSVEDLLYEAESLRLGEDYQSLEKEIEDKILQVMKHKGLEVKHTVPNGYLGFIEERLVEKGFVVEYEKLSPDEALKLIYSKGEDFKWDLSYTTVTIRW